jgi:hypothetical protein
MHTIRPVGVPGASSGGPSPDRRLPLRWLVIGVIAAIAAVPATAAAGQHVAILVAVGVAAALHRMIE